MISIDPKTLGLSNSSKIKKSSKKDQNKGVKFLQNSKTKESSGSETSTGVADIGGMLFLQEFDQLSEDQQNLEEFSRKAFKILKNLQLDLLDGKIESRRLHNLQDALNSNKFDIHSEKLANLAEEIKLRIEVEIAKIEMNKK